MNKPISTLWPKLLLALAAACAGSAMAQTKLADAPIVVSTEVPPNVMMTMSVEWPTGTVAAYNDNASSVTGYTCSGRDAGLGVCYFPTREYLGYFDNKKCYAYDATLQYFVPKALLVTPTDGSPLNVDCTSKTGRWSGNLLNWASMHAIDSFRFAMTGGDRVVDTATESVVEKSQHTGQGGYTQFPIKRIGTAFTANGVTVPATAPSTQSPESWTNLYARITDNSRRLWQGSTHAGKVLQVANNTGFLNAFSNGRYVRVQLVGTNYLSLAEVQVRDPAGTTNWANGRTATQSSTTNGGLPGRAVDNNTNGTYGSNSVTHTALELQPWWQVDLSASRSIGAISIYNRTDCCEDRLTNFYVFVSTTDMTGRSLDSLLNDSAVWKYFQGDQITDSGAGTSDGVADGDRELKIKPATTDVSYTMNAQVRVCDTAVGVEENCKAYGSSWKPTGIIQDKADKMRFGVMAYLNVDGTSTMGGVLRSPLKYVGGQTIVPNGTPGSNPRYEIDSATGVVRNDPEGVVVAGGEYASSGVINYINRFGKLGTKGTMKSQDTMSEMYYEGLRYMRGYSAATPEFINFPNANTAAARDGFPIYTDWTLPEWSNVAAIDKKPVQYWCQKSNFVGIGDTNTWCDSWGPGSSMTSGCPGHTGGPSDDTRINATTLGNAIGSGEGLGSIGSSWISASRWDGYYLASYAYWANVNDIILDDLARGFKQSAVQTAQTYWVDVKETPSFNGIVAPKNQYWLAGKWGGFNSKGGTITTPPVSYDPADKNYFTGERPDKLIKAMRAVFDNITASTGTAAPTALASNDLSTGSESYQVSFNSGDWTGEVIASSLSFDAGGELQATERWKASDKIKSQNWDTGRRIVSFNPETGARNGVPFRYSASSSTSTLSSAQIAYFGTTSDDRRDTINYLRGERTYETSSPAKFRERDSVLGDIVNADPAFVGAPTDDLNEEFNPGFAAFATSNANRTKVLYVGANDGMLHAFNATPTSSGGNELFAYVPSALLPGPSEPATPDVDGLASRTKIAFEHRYFVDQGPNVRSVDFGNTAGGSGTASWHTLLVGGLGKGGKSMYALDVTDPSSFSSEATVAGKVLWEYTDPDLGFTFSHPVIAKTKAHGWVVLFTSGYNNTTSPTAASRGKGFLFVVNARTGALITKVSTGVGTEASPSGLAKLIGFTPDSTDFTVDSAYAGDLFGNVWRFDLTDSAGSYPAPTKIAELKDSGGAAQPITVAPRVMVYPGSLDRWVFVGTGRLLDLSDRLSTQDQAFYAFRDGIRSRFATSATLPAGVSFPLHRSDLAELTSLEDGLSADQRANKMGWYRDLTEQVDGANERIVDSIVANSGIVAFASKTPATDDECVSGVNSRVYAVDYVTGKTQLVNADGSPLGAYDAPGTVLRADFLLDQSGNFKLGLNSGGTRGGYDGAVNLRNGAGVPIRLNWREVIQ